MLSHEISYFIDCNVSQYLHLLLIFIFRGLAQIQKCFFFYFIIYLFERSPTSYDLSVSQVIQNY